MYLCPQLIGMSGWRRKESLGPRAMLKQDELAFNKLVDSRRRATVWEDARKKFRYRRH
jgi:hypothetical protein